MSVLPRVAERATSDLTRRFVGSRRASSGVCAMPFTIDYEGAAQSPVKEGDAPILAGDEDDRAILARTNHHTAVLALVGAERPEAVGSVERDDRLVVIRPYGDTP
jgi:hypothetical protein